MTSKKLLICATLALTISACATPPDPNSDGTKSAGFGYKDAKNFDPSPSGKPYGFERYSNRGLNDHVRNGRCPYFIREVNIATPGDANLHVNEINRGLRPVRGGFDDNFGPGYNQPPYGDGRNEAAIQYANPGDRIGIEATTVAGVSEPFVLPYQMPICPENNRVTNPAFSVYVTVFIKDGVTKVRATQAMHRR